MKNVPFRSATPLKLGKLFIACVLALGSASLEAEDVFVTSYKGTAGSSDVTPNPPFLATGTVSIFGASSSSASSATPIPVVPSTGRRVVYGNGSAATFDFTPTDLDVTPVAGSPNYHFSALQNIGLYKIYITKGSGATTHSTDLIMKMTGFENGTQVMLADTNGVGQMEVAVPFQRSRPNNTWIFVGYITNTIASPTIRFEHLSGNVDGTANRWNMDAVRFQFIDLCTPGGVPVAPQPSIGGPLVQNQTFVNVDGVVVGATNVSVFADGGKIGETNFAGGFAAGTVAVPTTALVKSSIIAAQQSKNGCTSQLASAGPPVGGGANAGIKVMLSCSKNAALTGPAGSNGTLGTGFPYILKADGLIGSFGSAPKPGQDLAASDCWQTVVFDPATDPAIDQNGGGAVPPNTDPFCALEGLVFAISDTDSGPYDIYVDQIMNGDALVENFEGYTAGAIGTFVAPNGAASPTASVYLSSPHSSTISANNAFDGTKSCRIQWQYSDSSSARWSKVLARGTGGGKVYPQLDTTKTITIRYLVLPVGSTTNKLAFPNTSANQTNSVGANMTLNAGAAGEGPFTYQWSYAGTDITGETGSTYTKSNLQIADSGAYSVLVTGAACNATNSVLVTVTDVVTPVRITYTVDSANHTVTLNWTGAGHILQSAADLNGSPISWQDVPGNPASGYQVNTANGAKYFRLRH